MGFSHSEAYRVLRASGLGLILRYNWTIAVVQFCWEVDEPNAITVCGNPVINLFDEAIARMNPLVPTRHLELIQQNKEEILAICSRHGAKNLRIFGSVAKGEAGQDSDIDFLVDYDLDRITPWFPAGLLIELESLLNCKVDVATVDMLKERIRERVLQEAIAL